MLSSSSIVAISIIVIVLIDSNTASSEPALEKRKITVETSATASEPTLKKRKITVETPEKASEPPITLTENELNGDVLIIDDAEKLDQLYSKFFDSLGSRAQSLMNPLCVNENLRNAACSKISDIQQQQEQGQDEDGPSSWVGDNRKKPSLCKSAATKIQLRKKSSTGGNSVFSQTTFECNVKPKKNGVGSSRLYVTPRGLKTNGVFVSSKLTDTDKQNPTVKFYVPNVYFDPTSEIRQKVKGKNV